MKEITAKKEYEPPEIRVINPQRTSPVPVHMDPRPIRKKRDLAEQRLQEREQGAEDYLDHLYATGQISPDEYARLIEM